MSILEIGILKIIFPTLLMKEFDNYANFAVNMVAIIKTAKHTAPFC